MATLELILAQAAIKFKIFPIFYVGIQKVVTRDSLLESDISWNELFSLLLKRLLCFKKQRLEKYSHRKKRCETESLKGLSNRDLERTFFHPESQETVFLKNNIGIYAWHCNHHYEHINQLLIRKGWK